MGRFIGSVFLGGVLGAVSPGCGLLLDTNPRADGVDAGPRDSGGGDGVVDAPPADVTVDGVLPDVGVDSAMPDAGGSCTPPVTDSTTVAYWGFEEAPTIVDSFNGYDGMVLGDGWGLIPHGGCGQALAFGMTGETAFVRVPNVDDFELTSGSLSLWVSLPAAPGPHGILSRDENGTDSSGHFLIATSDDGRVIVRNQGSGTSAWACSDAPVTPGEWVKLDVNFGDGGGLVLLVDGVPQTSTDTLSFSDGVVVDSVPCGVPGTDGLAGNSLPFVFGGATTRAADATVDPPNLFMLGGAIDEVILRSGRVGGL